MAGENPPRLPRLDLQPLQPGGKGGEAIFNNIQRILDGVTPNSSVIDRDLVTPPALPTFNGTIDIDIAAQAIIRSTGNWVTDGYVISQLVQVSGAANVENDGFYVVINITTTTTTNDTLIVAEPLSVNETATASVDVDVTRAEDGLRYLIDGVGTGPWNGQDGKLAIHYSGWIYIAPFDGMIVYVEDENRLVIYDGAAWQDGGTIADLNQTISGPSVAEVQAISDKIDDEILPALRTFGICT